MGKLEGKTALVTGASSGIGRSTAELLLKEGARVYIAARRVERMKDLEMSGAIVLEMDVTDEASIVSGIRRILEKEGAVDILVNNAGYGSFGAIEDMPIEEARRQFEVNVFGLGRITQLVLPAMRGKGSGRIVNISSMGGTIYTGFGGWYYASKHALEGLSDCLRVETESFGIDVVIIEPGAIATEWGAISAGNLKKTSGSGAYAASANMFADGMARMYASGRLSDPSVVGKAILKAVMARKPKTRYAVGYMAKPLMFLRRWISDRMFDRMVRLMG